MVAAAALFASTVGGKSASPTISDDGTEIWPSRSKTAGSSSSRSPILIAARAAERNCSIASGVAPVRPQMPWVITAIASTSPAASARWYSANRASSSSGSSSP
jgi:hypothetical protein